MTSSNNLEEPDYQFTFSRCSSTGSLHAASSANNTDDEDSDLCKDISVKDRRREAHTQAEQKRRDAIKKGYDALQDLVPTCQNTDQSHKLSKATVLQKSVDYILLMQGNKKKQLDELAALEKEVLAMTIMKMNYEHILSAHQKTQNIHSRAISDEQKFEVFRAMMDSLFRTCEPSISTQSFAEVSGSMIQWVEEHCKPQILREVVSEIVQQLHQHEMATSMSDASPNIQPLYGNQILPMVNDRQWRPMGMHVPSSQIRMLGSCPSEGQPMDIEPPAQMNPRIIVPIPPMHNQSPDSERQSMSMQYTRK